MSLNRTEKGEVDLKQILKEEPMPSGDHLEAEGKAGSPEISCLEDGYHEEN